MRASPIMVHHSFPQPFIWICDAFKVQLSGPLIDQTVFKELLMILQTCYGSPPVANTGGDEQGSIAQSRTS